VRRDAAGLARRQPPAVARFARPPAGVAYRAAPKFVANYLPGRTSSSGGAMRSNQFLRATVLLSPLQPDEMRQLALARQPLAGYEPLRKIAPDLARCFE
jgi:hypothetical protein